MAPISHLIVIWVSHSEIGLAVMILKDMAIKIAVFNLCVSGRVNSNGLQQVIKIHLLNIFLFRMFIDFECRYTISHNIIGN